MKFLMLLGFGLVGIGQAYAQSGIEVHPSELAEAEANQARIEFEQERYFSLMSSLGRVAQIQIKLQASTALPSAILFDDGNAISNGSSYFGGKTACLLEIDFKGSPSIRIVSPGVKLMLDSLLDYDLALMTVGSAVWKGLVFNDQHRPVAAATLTCSIGWMNLSGNQPKSLSASVVEFNLGRHACYLNK